MYAASKRVLIVFVVARMGTPHQVTYFCGDDFENSWPPGLPKLEPERGGWAIYRVHALAKKRFTKE